MKLRDMTMEQYKEWKNNSCHGSGYWYKDCLFHKVFCYESNDTCWVNNKELYSDKFLDQEIEIKEEK